MPNSPAQTEITSDASSLENGVDDQLIRMDIERYLKDGSARPPNVIHLWKVRLSARKGHLVSDLIKTIALFLTLVCISLIVYTVRLKDGLIRISNDSYDNKFPDDINRESPSIWDSDRQSFLHDALPVPVHSHNDYWRRIPLFEAVASGCTSVEADVYLRNNDLLVGHKSRDLHDDSTLRSMYLEPIQRMIAAQNVEPDGTLVPSQSTIASPDVPLNSTWRGIFDRASQQTLILLIDHKTSGPETFAELHAQLQPLRDLGYLTHWNGTARVTRPLTVVASGTAPFDSVLALDPSHRDIFWDAPLAQLPAMGDDFDASPFVHQYNISNSYLASTQWRNALFGQAADGDGPAAKDMSSPQIQQARARGLVSRYWDTPAGPPNVRDMVWRILVENEVGVVNMDDMGIVRDRAKAWGKIQH